VANIPTVGVFLPGNLNACNSAGPTGQTDAYGLQYPSGLNPGKVIELGTHEAQGLAAPGTLLYDGAYQWVRLDSGATAANATAGLAAFIKLDSGATQGALPMTAYEAFTVTTEDQVSTASQSNLFAGVFINPATIGGVANGPTPGNWCFIFVGAGRAAVQIGATASGTTVGSLIQAGTGTNAGKFNSVTGAGGAALTVNTVATAVTPMAANTAGVAYFENLFYRIPH
jgi:hypothetical protein